MAKLTKNEAAYRQNGPKTTSIGKSSKTKIKNKSQRRSRKARYRGQGSKRRR